MTEKKKFSDEESIGYLTALVAQSMSDSLFRSFKEQGIDLPYSQFLLLGQLFFEDGQTQQMLASNLHKDKASIKRTVDNLVVRGLVERRKSGGETKNIPLFITPKAQSLECQILDISRANFATIVDGISSDDLETTKSTLRNILANIGNNRS